MTQFLDPTFSRSAADAAAAPAEELAYVAVFDRAAEQHDAIAVLDVNPASPEYGRVVGWSEVSGLGDELHHFGWNACSTTPRSTSSAPGRPTAARSTSTTTPGGT
jgi:selenium-binding protein 1